MGLMRAVLKSANLDRAVLRDADLSHVDLEFASLRNADLTNAVELFRFSSTATRRQDHQT